jgi:parvulin-like peptidyl-prolyl cis-trans isomerase-like protein
MHKSWLLCVLFGALSWGQAAPGAPAPPQAPMPGARAADRTPAPDTSASVPADAAVITVEGVCPPQPKPAAAKGATVKPASAKAPADCKTVITKAQFEKLASAITPNVTPQVRKQLSNVLPRYIAMSAAAKKQGLDKKPEFEETVKFAKMQILTNELQRKVQEDAAKVSDADIKAYYDAHADTYEQYSLERLFVPRNKQVQPELKDEDKDKDEKLTDEQKKAKEAEKEAEEKTRTEQGEQEMTKLADSLRGRAAAGEDFAKLQKEAFEAAGMKIESPTVTLPKVRRSGLPPAHAAVFDLKVGDVSQVINDSGGHYIYKVDSKDQLSLDQTKQEIQNALSSQRTRDAMDKLNGSFKVETNEAYFGPPGPAMPPGRGMPPRGPSPRPMAPGAAGAAPSAPAQTPPPAQSQDAKPN